MKSTRRMLAVLAATIVALLAVSAGVAADAKGKKVVFTVGITSTNFDTLNPIMGYSAVDFDVWNTQYGTLTNKAAKDFAPIPGLAQSWKVSNERQDLHVHVA